MKCITKRRTMFILTLVLALSGLLASTALADGMMPPFPSEVGYLQVDYHRVTVTIDGPHAHTRVEQRFSNPYLMPVEARYVFPLPPAQPFVTSPCNSTARLRRCRT